MPEIFPDELVRFLVAIQIKTNRSCFVQNTCGLVPARGEATTKGAPRKRNYPVTPDLWPLFYQGIIRNPSYSWAPWNISDAMGRGEDKCFRNSPKWDEALDQHQWTQLSRKTTLWNKLLRLIWRFGRGWWEASVKCIWGFPLWTALRYAIGLNLWLQASEKWVKYWRLRWNKVNVQP